MIFLCVDNSIFFSKLKRDIFLIIKHILNFFKAIKKKIIKPKIPLVLWGRQGQLLLLSFW